MEKVCWHPSTNLYRKAAHAPASNNLMGLFLSKIPQPASRFIQHHPFIAAVVVVGSILCIVWVLSKFWRNPDDVQSKPKTPSTEPETPKAAQKAHQEQSSSTTTPSLITPGIPLSQIDAKPAFDFVSKLRLPPLVNLTASYALATLRNEAATLTTQENKINSLIQNNSNSNLLPFASYDLSNEITSKDLQKLLTQKSNISAFDKICLQILSIYLNKNSTPYQQLKQTLAPSGWETKSDAPQRRCLLNFIDQASAAKDESALLKTEFGQYLQVMLLIESYKIFLKQRQLSAVHAWIDKSFVLWIIKKASLTNQFLFMEITRSCATQPVKELETLSVQIQNAFYFHTLHQFWEEYLTHLHLQVQNSKQGAIVIQDEITPAIEKRIIAHTNSNQSQLDELYQFLIPRLISNPKFKELDLHSIQTQLPKLPLSPDLKPRLATILQALIQAQQSKTE